MANKTFIEEKDAGNYTLKLADVERETGWSRAKVYRKLPELKPVYLATNKNEMLFNEETVLKASGAITAEIVSDEPETPQETALEKQQPKAAAAQPKAAPARKSQENLTPEKNNVQSINEIRAMFVLPHKRVKTLKDAAMLSGLPADFLKGYGVQTPSGYKFTDERINRAVDDYISHFERNPYQSKSQPPKPKTKKKK